MAICLKAPLFDQYYYLLPKIGGRKSYMEKYESKNGGRVMCQA